MDSNPKTFFHPRHLGEPRDNIAALDRNSCHSRPPVVPDPPLSCSPISNAVPSTNQENTATSTPNLATPTLVRCGGTTLKGGRCRREKILSSVGTNVEWFCFDHVTQASGYDVCNGHWVEFRIALMSSTFYSRQTKQHPHHQHPLLYDAAAPLRRACVASERRNYPLWTHKPNGSAVPNTELRPRGIMHVTVTGQNSVVC
jgi:hypothetical protein